MAEHDTKSSGDNRRSFVAAAGAIIAGAVAVLTPLGIGLASFFSPLRRKASPTLVRVALLNQIPDDGMPHLFPVLADRIDAWNRYSEQRIGAVYLTREKGEQQPTALSAKCPHAGCYVGHAPGAETFQCPCHTSAFHLDGTRVNGDAEVAPRGMDPLKVDLRSLAVDDAEADEDEVVEVWVEFIDFQTGRKERIPTA